ncbi:hypothetical protein CEXT_766621 [Caerostris extrusa]|uniref:Uncharacterized protein n=1 Tax=Caerostris extrusa TaxID=172846 RepID=A0AAV4NBF2_CAEEX|nr:hypothetical protein CEXT_766621 [Caerostris extrusa]
MCLPQEYCERYHSRLLSLKLVGDLRSGSSRPHPLLLLWMRDRLQIDPHRLASSAAMIRSNEASREQAVFCIE